MDSNNDSKSSQFGADMPLPGGDGPNEAESKIKKGKDKFNPAADLIRKKVEAAYEHEPSAKEELREAEEQPASHRSKHQQFIYELTSSGRPLHEIQTAWHEYYAGLTDREKHQVWQEFYATHAEIAQHPAMAPETVQPKSATVAVSGPAAPATHRRPAPATYRTGKRQVKEVTKQSLAHAASRVRANRAKPKRPRPAPKTTARQAAHSLAFGIGIGCLVIVIFLFSFFNERIIAPFIQPSRNAANIPIIADAGAAGPNPEIIIPKINVEIPVVYSVNSYAESAIDDGLEQGVVHYPNTAVPGQDGNVVIVGHSSNNIFNPGKYKFAFVLLDRMNVGDTFYLQKDGKRYTYQIYKRQIVSPSDVAVLGPAEKPASATLITCDPPGTSANRLVVTGQQISPDPASNLAAGTPKTLPSNVAIVPGNSPSLWSRIVGWFTN